MCILPALFPGSNARWEPGNSVYSVHYIQITNHNVSWQGPHLVVVLCLATVLALLHLGPLPFLAQPYLLMACREGNRIYRILSKIADSRK